MVNFGSRKGIFWPKIQFLTIYSQIFDKLGPWVKFSAFFTPGKYTYTSTLQFPRNPRDESIRRRGQFFIEIKKILQNWFMYQYQIMIH